MAKNIIHHLEELGIGRSDVLNLTESDYVRLSKEIKLNFKKQEDSDLNVLSNLLDVLRDDLENLKAIFAEDLIYFTLSKRFKAAKKSKYFYYTKEKDADLRLFFLKYFKEDLLDEFKQLIVAENYKDLKSFMIIDNLYPEEIKIELQELLIQQIEPVIEFLKLKKTERLKTIGLKWMRSVDYFSVLSIRKSELVTQKLSELVELFYEKYKKANSKASDFEFDLLKLISIYPHLSRATIKKNEDIRTLIMVKLAHGKDDGSGTAFTVIAVSVIILIAILIVAGLKSYIAGGSSKEKVVRRVSAVDPGRSMVEADLYLDNTMKSTESDCDKAYQSCHAMLMPYTRKYDFSYTEEKMGLKHGDEALMGLKVELPLMAIGNDMFFVNKMNQPVLLIIVRPNYVVSYERQTIVHGTGNELGCGRYYVAPNETLKFDARIKYLKIQTGKNLKQVKITGERLFESLIGYTFCPFTELDAKLYKLQFSVTNPAQAIGGLLELSRTSSKYNLSWNGNDSAIQMDQGIYLKRNSNLKIVN